ncbi:pre-peptidase C-terminal domain-containing protein [Suttonella ornithocola]|uniref:pre-peptidase C-terminal domain-containing protein n=1 Tax=Suttonella ornithocola TaxID=279832 RepID=UPI001160BEEE|nr:pre-peptidase C-terminal domain-containing protein [Suttonella ornithocola]
MTIDVNGTLSTHTVTADEANAHSITASVDIPSSQDGTVVVKASVTATATGNTPAANSAQDDVIVDTAATVDIKSIGGIRQGSADKNDVYATITSDAKNLVFSGSATNVENGSTVTISIQDDSGHEVSSVTAITNNGSWTSNGIPVNIVQGMKNGTYKAVATVTDAAGNTATDTDLFAVNVNRISPQPVIKSVDNTDVSEGALTNGMQKNVNGSAMGVTDSGSIKFSDGNATRYTVGKTGASDTAGKVYLTTDGLPTDLYAENGTAQGAQVTWNVSGDGKTLTGMADVNGTGSQKVITITLNDAASKSGTDFTQGYTTTLHHAIKHDIVDGQNVKDIAVTAKVTDGVGTVDAQFTVNVYDDTPVVSNNATDVTPVAIQKAPPANVTIMIDYSSSMSIGNREAKVESTIIKVIEKYQENDDARFNLIAFGNGTRQLGGKWVTASEALAILKDPSTSNFALTNTAYPQSGASVGTRISSGTDMDAALKTAMDTFTQSGKLSDAQNISYFFTDADESAGKLVPPKDINTWHTFLDNNNITSYAVGMSGGSNYAEIFKGFGIGYDPNQKNVSAKDVQIDGTHLNAYYTDAQQVQFENHLTGTVKLGTVSSSLFTQNSYTGIASLSGIGADGGYLTSVTVNGKTATWNGTGTLTGGTGIDTSKATADNPIATITTSQGKLTVNFATGEYTYQMNGGLKGAREAVEFIVTDRDGDKANGSQTIEFYAFSANNDIILTNQQSGTLTFNEDVLLANDNSRSPKADITLKGSASGVSQSGDSISVSLPTISAGQTVAEKTTVNKDLSSAQTINSSDFGSVNNASVASGAGWKFVNIEGKAETWDEGTLFSKWDVEFYKVHLKAGDTLNYGYTQTTGQGGDDIQIYNASNQKVSEVQTNGNTATTEVGTFTATQEGDYYVRLSNKQDSSAYKVQLAINDHQSHDFDYTLTESADNTDSAHVSVQQVGGNTITGTDANEVLIGSDGTKALNGGGGDDVLVYHNGIGHYDGGTGSDTLFFNEANLIIDSTVLANKVDNVETLYLAKDGVDQTLTIKASDVFSISGSNQLIIHAGAEDHINLTGFSKGATDNETGLTSYTSGNVTVKIDSYLPDDHIII